MEPIISGEWWIEDGVFHIIDIESQADHSIGWECQLGAEGTYEIIKLPEDRIKFTRIEDPCVVEAYDEGRDSRYHYMVQIPYNMGFPPQELSIFHPSKDE